MSENYYKPCKELDTCNNLIEKYWYTEQYDKCFEGHLALAEKGYPLAECQVGFFYLEGIGIEKNLNPLLFIDNIKIFQILLNKPLGCIKGVHLMGEIKKYRKKTPFKV